MTELDVYALWVDKAESDWRAAEILLSADDPAYEAACFHLQQCAEKYIKAFLSKRSIPFKKTHDLGVLVELLPVDKRPSVMTDDMEALSVHAVSSRYPGMGDELTMNDVSRAQKTTLEIRKFVREANQNK